jgi:uncharacterized NAD(P)/FAD-binding protein YdhS
MSDVAAFDIVIVGAGFSGAALSVHLARHAPAECSIAVVDSAPDTGRGRAYSDPSGQVLLNVPAARMSLDPSLPLDFANWWAQALGSTVEAIAADFAPRAEYGRYVQTRWTEALAQSPARITRLQSRVLDVETREGGFRVSLADGGVIDARRVVLALGHAPPVLPQSLSNAASAGRIVDPLTAHALDQLPRSARLLILGTGLTAVDALGRLATLGHHGPVLCVSRHGRWPAVHRTLSPTALPAVDAQALAASPRSALRHVRDLVERHTATGGDWRAVIDALRPHTAPTWRAWGDSARRQALRHLRSPWDVHRHRMAPAAAETLGKLGAMTELGFRAGRLVDTRLDADGRVTASIKRRGSDTIESWSADAILVGLAPAIAFGQRQDPLARALLARGLVRDDAVGFGIEVDSEGRPIGVTGQPTPGLHAIGPLLRGRDWETTAVPEIREQAAVLALRLLAS